MCVVRWLRCHWVAIALLTVIVALAGVEAMAAVASPVRGATYEGRGRQPHFLLAGSGAPSGSFIVQFRVTRNGRQVTQLYVSGLIAACSPGRYTQPAPRVGSAPIRPDGTFRADMRDTISGARGSPIMLTGRFLSQDRSSGTLRYRGRGPYKGCNADGIWTARVKPPPPPVQHFTGTTDQGTRVTFERTIERRPRVTRFKFGSLRATFADGEQCGPVTVATGPEFVPPFNQFSLPVHQGRFFGRYFPGGGYGVDISGRFDVKDQASGTVSYADRGDCSTCTVHWTAHRAGQNQVRTLRQQAPTTFTG